MYYILRKDNYTAGAEFDTDVKAKKSYASMNEALQKKTALETLNDSNEFRQYIIVQDVA